MWSVNVMYLLLFCYASLSTGDDKVYFVSKNFYNVLHWDPATPAFPGQKVFYSVMYWRDDQDEYQKKIECQNITRLSCNLTAETPSQPNIYYRAKVMVNGRSRYITTRFQPLRDTVLGPPRLSTRTTASALFVHVTLQEGPNGVSIADIINSSKEGYSKTVPEYILRITKPEWAAQEVQNTAGRFDVKLKSNQTEYCGDVFYKLREWGRADSENAIFCVTLQDNLGMDLRWLLVSLAVLSAAVIILVVCVCTYLKGGKVKRMPQVLVATPGSCNVLQHPDKNLIISEIHSVTKIDPTVYNPIQVKSKVSPHRFGGYSPQDTPCHICRCNADSSSTRTPETASHSEDTRVPFSESYGAVAVHDQVKDREESQQFVYDNSVSPSPLYTNQQGNWGGGGMIPKLIPSGTPQFPHSESSEDNLGNKLVLHTVRNINGQLVLPLFRCPSEDSTGDTVSQMHPERKPLLSDPMDLQGVSLACLQRSDSSDWTDSGCDDSIVNTPTNLYYNTTFFLSQKAGPDLHNGCDTLRFNDVETESGYKQNWVPETHHKLESNGCTSISPKLEEDVEDDEGTMSMENSGQSFLGHWDIKIQT